MSITTGDRSSPFEKGGDDSVLLLVRKGAGMQVS